MGPGEDTERFETVEATPAPPPGPPPGAWLDDVWPWLALLAVLAVAALLVWLFVFRDRHHAARTVPSVVGTRQQAAIGRLTSAGYAVRAYLVAAKRPRGIVAAQTPGGGAQLPRGSTVRIDISNGHAPPTTVATTAATTTTATTRVKPSAPSGQVPDVTGQPLATASGQIDAAGFVPQSEPVQQGGTPGTVVGETPAGGGQAPVGSNVTLDVAFGSSRPAVQIPSVVGRSAADARAAIVDAKLTVKTVYEKGKTGVVLSQSSTGSVPEWTRVTITVGQ